VLMLNDIGLSKAEIRREIQKHLDENADLVIGIDDPEMVQLIEVLCDGFSEAISANNKKIADDLKRNDRDMAMRLR